MATNSAEITRWIQQRYQVVPLTRPDYSATYYDAGFNSVLCERAVEVLMYSDFLYAPKTPNAIKLHIAAEWSPGYMRLNRIADSWALNDTCVSYYIYQTLVRLLGFRIIGGYHNVCALRDVKVNSIVYMKAEAI